jgi:hypothetical protein
MKDLVGRLADEWVRRSPEEAYDVDFFKRLVAAADCALVTPGDDSPAWVAAWPRPAGRGPRC